MEYRPMNGSIMGGRQMNINARLALHFMVYSTRREEERRGGMSDEDHTDRGR